MRACAKHKRCEACGHRGASVQFHFGMVQGDFCYPSCAVAREWDGAAIGGLLTYRCDNGHTQQSTQHVWKQQCQTCFQPAYRE